MKFFKNIVWIVCICALYTACIKKELTPGTVQQQPVFSFNGIIGATSLNLQAGINNYYMYSSYNYTDSLQLYSFTGNLQNTGTNKTSIQITINDDTARLPGQSSDINKSVSPSVYYAYNTPGTGGPLQETVTFTPKIYSGIPTLYTYYFGDGSTYTTNSATPPSHIYNIPQSKQTYTTALAVQFNACGTVVAANPLLITNQGTSQLAIDSVTSIVNNAVTKDSSTSYHIVKLKAYTNAGQTPCVYWWWFGDGDSIRTSYDTITHAYRAPAKSHNVIVGVRYVSGGDSVGYVYNFTDSVSSHCRLDYFLSTPQPVPNTKRISNVLITYVDANGVQYTSNSLSQPNISTFQVTSVSNYQNNEKNQPTKMLQVQFNCVLYNTVTGAPVPANGTATIAVAYH